MADADHDPLHVLVRLHKLVGLPTYDAIVAAAERRGEPIGRGTLTDIFSGSKSPRARTITRFINACIEIDRRRRPPSLQGDEATANHWEIEYATALKRRQLQGVPHYIGFSNRPHSLADWLGDTVEKLSQQSVEKAFWALVRVEFREAADGFEARLNDSLSDIAPSALRRHHLRDARPAEVPEAIQLFQSNKIRELVETLSIVFLALDSNQSSAFQAAAGDREFAVLRDAWFEDRPPNHLCRDIWAELCARVRRIASMAQPLLLNVPKPCAKIEQFRTAYSYIAQRQWANFEWSRSILSILSDVDRTCHIPSLAEAILDRFASASLELEMPHIDEDARLSASEMYISRTLRRADEVVSSNDCFEMPGRRSVVLGDPGVGKTTLLRHWVRRAGAVGPVSPATPILITIREYERGAWGQAIERYISDTLERDFRIQVRESQLLDLFTFGAATLMFDGIDEIREVERRRKMVRQIEALATDYPLVSIVCTSRLIGYQHARFGHDFELLRLVEYSDDEVIQYVTRWFSLTGLDGSFASRFLKESTGSRDIRRNPLMLSLLCNMYKKGGFIPRNRRQVCQRCADLLFQNWDGLKGIKQPYDHLAFGGRLMQQMALYVFESNSLDGVSETPLIRVLASTLIDAASVSDDQAYSRATEFLNYCAERTWLLTFKGYDDKAERLFAFSHRTFLDFYFAEAWVRKSRTLGRIIRKMREVYDADPSSIVPVLLSQSADAKDDRWGNKIVETLIAQLNDCNGPELESRLTLVLEICNANAIGRETMQLIRPAVAAAWQRLPFEATYGSSRAALSVHESARNALLDMPRDTGDVGLGIELYKRYAALSLLGEAELFDDDWRIDLRQFGSRLASAKDSGPSLRLAREYYACHEGIAALRLPIKHRTAVVHVFNQTVPGAIVRSIKAITLPDALGGPANDHAVLARFADTLPGDPVDAYTFLAGEEGQGVLETLQFLGRHMRSWPTVRSNWLLELNEEYPKSFAAIVWFGCLLSVGSKGRHEFLRVYGDSFSAAMVTLSTLCGVRSPAIRRLYKGQISDAVARQFDTSCPWLLDWLSEGVLPK